MEWEILLTEGVEVFLDALYEDYLEARKRETGHD